MRQWLKDHPVLAYVVLAYAITWLCWIPTLLVAQSQGYLLPFADNYARLAREGFDGPGHITAAIVFFLAVYGPLAAGFVVTWQTLGRDGLAAWLRRITRWRVPPRWYGIVVLINLILLAVPLLIGVITRLMPVAEMRFPPIGFLALMFLVQILTSGLGEEPGWRGYLFPVLQDRLGSEKAVWRLGLIWAVWHYPFTLFFTLATAGDVPPAGLALTAVLGLAGNTISLIGMTYLYAWLYNRTGSVFLAILFHALNNVVPLVVAGGLHPSLSLALAVMPWVLVLFLERVYGKAWFVAQTDET